LIRSASLKHSVLRKEKGKFRETSERAFQKKVISYLNTQDCYHFKVIKANRSGVADIVGSKKGRFFAIELKKESGKLSELQKHHAMLVKQSKGVHYSVRPSEFEEFKVAFDSL